MIVDFTEINPANSSDGHQDQFEFFARDYVEALGFTILSNPDRGQDGGKDLIISETLSGIRISSQRTWILSAKHFAHSGKSIGVNDEINIRDRVERHKADGFFGFYSTLPSSGFSAALKGLKDKIVVDYLDKGMIQNELITNPGLENVFRAYFPISFLKFKSSGGYPATTKDLHTSYTGGDAYPSISYGMNSEGSVLPMIRNYGTYTIYDLDVIISFSSEPGGHYIVRESFPFLHPQTNVYCKSFNISKIIKKGEINSQIYARNGLFYQTTKLGIYKEPETLVETIKSCRTIIHKQSHQSKIKDLIHSTSDVIKYWSEQGKPLNFIEELRDTET